LTMVKLFSTDHTFAHPFDRVTSAFWRKYPNEQADHVLAIDCYDRKIILTKHKTTQEQEQTDNDNHQHHTNISNTSISTPLLVTNRLISCSSVLPSWLNRLGVTNHAYAIESTVVNPITKEMIVKSRNMSGSSLMIMEEICHYSPCSINPSTHTSYSQQAEITAFLPIFAARCENFTVQNVQKKSSDGLNTIEQLCQTIQSEGIQTLFI